ncbi:MAG: HlyC/CorC family transporter [Ruminococcaceae bacterium]|nr:HlyC/CorC family transporter [Oscillospiraceae bacterium]
MKMTGEETKMNDSFRYIAIVILILVSAFFSATEIAYASVNPARLKSRRQQKDDLALSLASRIVDDYNNTLGAILIGNNLANTASSAIATLIVIDLFGENYVWLATVSMTVLVLTFGEIIPKVLAKQMAEQFCYITAIPIYALSVILKPVTWIIMGIVKFGSLFWKESISDSDSVSEDDFENIIEIVEDEGVLDEEQCDLLQNALEFDEVLAYEIITPRVDMEALDIRDPYEVNIRKIDEATYSRLPIFEDTPDNIIGILHLNHFYKAFVEKEKVSIRELMLPVTFVHKTMPLPDVLEKMKESKTHMVVVLDEYGGTMGILTMEDVLEQLVGEIFDETDEIEREFVCIDDTHFEADGDMRVYDFFDEFDIDIEDEETLEGDTATIGGWVVSMLDGSSEEGDSFVFENLRITVKQSDGVRIEKILVEEIEEE